jgi:hypothetical protein
MRMRWTHGLSYGGRLSEQCAPRRGRRRKWLPGLSALILLGNTFRNGSGQHPHSNHQRTGG